MGSASAGRVHRSVKQMMAKLVDAVYSLMKIEREDELTALINFVSRSDMHESVSQSVLLNLQHKLWVP